MTIPDAKHHRASVHVLGLLTFQACDFLNAEHWHVEYSLPSPVYNVLLLVFILLSSTVFWSQFSFLPGTWLMVCCCVRLWTILSWNATEWSSSMKLTRELWPQTYSWDSSKRWTCVHYHNTIMWPPSSNTLSHVIQTHWDKIHVSLATCIWNHGNQRMDYLCMAY